ncbi:MAG: glucose-6-phosphate isomerase, partial [Alphaproteobacteria bacterium]|nr:glucose-6-phosphate isomerase [Alphaproteobacteria bacterium]
AVVSQLMGFDFTDFRRGAQSLIQNFDFNIHLQGAYHTAFLNRNHGVNQSVIMVYADGLELFAEWFCQLWGESLGKKRDNQFYGITPVRALGAVDQHSQLQLYLDGPRDKLITFITLDQHEETPIIQPTHIDHPCFQMIEGHTMAQLFRAEEAGTYETLKKNNCHLRKLSLSHLGAFEMGQLMMFYMIETIATAYLLGVNPFDQPAVEDSKKQAMIFLKNGFKI